MVGENRLAAVFQKDVYLRVTRYDHQTQSQSQQVKFAYHTFVKVCARREYERVELQRRVVDL
jgi:hypothetical protein